jgi:hypothetical protein
MNIFLSPYVLKKNDSSGLQEGTLIKVSEQNFFGVADICPHPHLGDLTWKAEVKEQGPLFKRALQLAQEDLRARKNGLSLLSDQKVESNILILNLESENLNHPEFSDATVKIKAGKNVRKLADRLNGLKLNLKIRLDFNAQLTIEEFDLFLSLISPEALKRIEYIEDPAKLSEKWKLWNSIVPLASDWEKTNDRSLATYSICKPAREEVPESAGNVIFTSVMDHAVGFAHGLRIAQRRLGKVHGFSTLGLYEKDNFSKYFEKNHHQVWFSKPALEDSGIGMTHELNNLSWLPVAKVTNDPV